MRTRAGFWTIVAFATILSAIAVASAWRAQDRIFPSFLFDHAGSYSLVDMPHWGNESLRLSRNGRIVRVGEVTIDSSSGYLRFPGNRIRSLLDSAYRHRPAAKLVFADGDILTERLCPLKRIGSIETLLLFWVYLFFGWFALLFALILRASVPENRARLNTLLLALVLGFLFLASFFDYHTNGWLFPGFQISNVMTPLTILYLCFDYPYPLLRSRTLRRIVQLALTAYFVAGVIDQVVLPLAGRQPLLAAGLIDAVTKASFLLAGLLVIVRIFSGKTEERGSFVAIGIANGAMILILGGSIALSLAFQIRSLRFIVNLLLPFVPTFFILFFSYSVIRHNLLETGTIFKRKVFLIPVLFLALSLAMATYTLLSFWSGHHPGPTLLDAGLFLTLLFTYGWMLDRLTVRLFFNVLRSFRSKLSGLSDSIAGMRSEAEVAGSLHRMVQDWLVHHQVEVEIRTDGESNPPMLEPRGNSVFLPMLCHGKTLGAIVVTPDFRSPLLTDEDMNLLRMVATLGAIGINNIRNMNALEAIHRQNIDLTRKENLLSLQVFSAEVAHEIQYPITYFKYLLGELDGDRPLDREDVVIGNDEVRRLERMVLSMKQFRHPSLELRPVNLLETVKRVLILLKDVLERHGVAPIIEVPPEVVLIADQNLLIQLLSNLLKNAAEASGEGGLVLAGWRAVDDGSCTIEIRDAGPGLPDADVFSPWVTTKKEGRGIGLTVCQRIVRAFHWDIAVARQDGQTCFSIKMPRESVSVGEGASA